MEHESTGVMGRGALLGPEESGAVRGSLLLGLELFLLGHCSTSDGWVGWLGPALTRLLVGASDGWVVSLEGVLVLISGGSGWFLPVF